MRTTNLLQSYVNNSPALVQYNSDRAKDSFDVKKELTNRTFIKPLPSNSQMVRNTIFDVPAELYKDSKYNLKALKHAIKGEATDHELGCLNDLGMKLGGIAIASYLYARKKTPLTKIMEFVGVASFFTAMDIWPKLALQLPASLIHGFNIRQEYRDQFGTKKPVFQDHQFIPWDLYSDAEINKIGDRMGVPKDIKNRRDFIQEKMRKIALQNNTMWMLTAGFATPIMSALICNALEKPVASYQDQRIDKQAEKLIENVDKEAMKYPFKEYNEKIQQLLQTNKDKPITKELLKEITQQISEGIDPVTAQSIEKDLQEVLIKDGFDFSKESLEKVRETMKKGFEVLELPAKDLEEVIPSAQELYDSFASKGLLEGENIKEGVTDFTEHVKTIFSIMDGKIDAYSKKVNNPDIAEDLQVLLENMFRRHQGKNPEIYEALSAVPSSKLSETLINKLSELTKVLSEFKSKNMVIDKYAYLKAGQAPETILANTWNNISEDLLKIFQFTPEEIKKVRHDREIAGDLLREKYEKIVANDQLYDETVKAISEKLLYLENRTDFANIDKWNKDQDNKYKQAIDSAFEKASKKLNELGMHNTEKRLVGFEDVDSRSLKDLKLSFMIDRVKGVKSSFYRLLNTLDLYRRISKIEGVENILSAKMPREKKEALVEMCKQLLIKGHSSDYAVKFYFPIHTDLNPQGENQAAIRAAANDFSQIETKDGRVVNRYLTSHPVTELADNAYDQKTYDEAMKLMYKEGLHNDTEKVISGTNFYNKFMQYRKDIYDFLGGDSYFAKTHHIAEGASGGGSSELRFLLLGATPDEIFTNLCSQKFNGNKWLKTFGLSAVGLLGITTLSQLFLGKMKEGGKK